MRVCLITSASLPPEEGIGHHVWSLAQQLKCRGHRVGIITRGGLAPTTLEKEHGIAIWRAPFVACYPFHVHMHGVFVNRLLQRIEGQFDLINVHTPLPPVVNTSLPVVTTVHSPMRADTAATPVSDLRTLALHVQTPVAQRIEAALLHRSHKIAAVASWVAEALRPYGVDPAEVTVTGNGVEARFLVAPTVQGKEPTVLYVGRLASGKGLPELVSAARIVIDRHQDPALRFVLVGRGPLLSRLCHLVSEAGLQGRFDFRGDIPVERRDELVRLYQRSSIFVLPSHHEGMSTALLEAMACGLPVVSTAVGGAPEVVVDGENGLLVPPRDPKALAEALLTLLADDRLCQRLGRNAEATIERHHTWDAVGARYVACFEQVLDDRR
ncbi:MAG TPA: glycosyltransferase family 4 protein [Anaerolineae bacterium]|nr:glycosyltransferase family 4 protein [Anaerolineae bacterium]